MSLGKRRRFKLEQFVIFQPPVFDLAEKRACRY